jgi:hypothetical protein
MTGRVRARTNRFAIALVAALAAAFAAACGPEYFEIPIETPIQPKLDVSPFQRVLVAGFVAGGTEDVDANQETVRLLRSQLRTKSSLKVIDADVLPLIDIAQDQNRAAENLVRESNGGPSGNGAGGQEPHLQNQPLALPQKIKDEKDLEPYERLFANTAYWKKIGEEYQNPLIVTGTVLFTPHQQAGFVTQNREVYDSFGRRSVIPVRTYMERKGFILEPRFIFIDGRTGATLYSEKFREEVLYPTQQNTPALSSYFELMDRLMPSFLSTLSAQKIRGTRVLLK